jgi:hypothetical protein
LSLRESSSGPRAVSGGASSTELFPCGRKCWTYDQARERSNSKMCNTDIDDVIGQFEAGYINKIDFDIFSHTISIDVDIFLNETDKEPHKLIFEGVSAFFFDNGAHERRFQLLPWEKAEISEIHYYKKSENRISFNSEKPDFPSYVANVNYYIEIWSSLFLIEAKAVLVDGKRFIS